MRNARKIIGFLSLPITLALVTYILFLNASSLPKPLTLALPYISYAFFVIGMLLGIRFNKSKVFFLCLILSASQLLLSDTSLTFKESDLSDMLSFLIPINILLLSIAKERGIFTLWGKLKFGAIVAQSLLVRLLLDPPNHDLRELISYKFIDLNWLNTFMIPQLSMLLFLIVFIFLASKLYLNPLLIYSSLAGAAALIFAGIASRGHFMGISLFFGAAGLILNISLVETSYSMAYKDELTGLPSRRALEESMLKLGSRYAIAMADIDHFKKFNDSYGHDIGDKVLNMVASSLMESEIGGRAFRYGGEEFTILFPGKTLAEVIPLLEELRINIAKQKHSYKKKGKANSNTKKLGVTLSIGVAEKSEKYKTVEEVIQAADKALYRAKKNGRNCVSK